MNLRFHTSLVLVCAVSVAAAMGCSQPRDNTPPQAIDDSRVDSVVSRGLNTYFSKRAGAPVVVEHLYLRRGPTVTGIAYPKFYLWISAQDSSGHRPTAEGAVRVALIDSVIAVTHFFPKDFMAREPASMDSVFPPAVVSAIRQRL